jgi:hypothetical protein
VARLDDRIGALSSEKQELLERLVAAGSRAHSVEPRRPWTPKAPTTAQQRRLWAQQQSDPTSTFANVQIALELRGPLDVPALVRSLQTLASRHEGLRVTFRDEAGGLVQEVGDPSLEILERDLRSYADAERAEMLALERRAERELPFALESQRPIRARIVRLGETTHAFFLTVHHIVMDGWARHVLVHELTTSYVCEQAGTTNSPPRPRVHLPDYAVWQNTWLRSLQRFEQSLYWSRKLAGAPRFLDLGSRIQRPAEFSFERAYLPFTLDGGPIAALRRIGIARHSTLFMGLLTALAAILASRSDARELVIGVPIAGRHEPALEDSVGLYTNAVPLRLEYDPASSFYELLAQVRATAEEAYAHQQLPIEELIAELEPSAPADRTPLFQTMFTVYNYRPEPATFAGLDALDIRDAPPNAIQVYSPALVPIDLCIGVGDPPGKVEPDRQGFVEYNRRVIDDETVREIVDDWSSLLAWCADHPDRSLGQWRGRP